MTESVRTKIARDAYTNNQPRPRAEDMAVFYVYDKGTVVVNGLPATQVTPEMKADWKAKNYLVDAQKGNDDKLTQARRAHTAETNRLMDEFRADVERENGVEGHPKLEKVWTLVGNERSSLTEKVDFFEDLITLIQ